MDKIVTLSNGLKLAFIGNVYPVLFEDNTMLMEWEKGSPYYVNGSNTIITTINNKVILTSNVTVELADWIKEEIRQFIIFLKTREIDLIICNPTIIHLVYEYINLFRSDIDIYTLDIMENDPEEKEDIARLNLFLKFNPNLL